MNVIITMTTTQNQGSQTQRDMWASVENV